MSGPYYEDKPECWPRQKGWWMCEVDGCRKDALPDGLDCFDHAIETLERDMIEAAIKSDTFSFRAADLDIKHLREAN